MELRVYYDTDNEIIIAKPAGNITNDNINTTFSKALEYSKKHDCNFLLIDIRKCTIAQSEIDGFLFMKDMTQKTKLSLEHWIAVVFDPMLYPKERAQFIENTVVNRPNPSYRMFMFIDEAILWLKNMKRKVEKQ